MQVHDSAVVSGLRCLCEHRLQLAPFPAPRVLVSDLCAVPAAAAAGWSCVSCSCHWRQRCSATTAALSKCSTTPCSCCVKHSRSRRRRQRHQQPATEEQEAQDDAVSTTDTFDTLSQCRDHSNRGSLHSTFFILFYLHLCSFLHMCRIYDLMSPEALLFL